jgi:hypothetical protein
MRVPNWLAGPLSVISFIHGSELHEKHPSFISVYSDSGRCVGFAMNSGPKGWLPVDANGKGVAGPLPSLDARRIKGAPTGKDRSSGASIKPNSRSRSAALGLQ